MTLFDMAVIGICLVGLVASAIGYRWSCDNVYLKYKDQRVGAK